MVNLCPRILRSLDDCFSLFIAGAPSYTQSQYLRVCQYVIPEDIFLAYGSLILHVYIYGIPEIFRQQSGLTNNGLLGGCKHSNLITCSLNPNRLTSKARR